MSGLNPADWRILIRRILEGKVTPFVSNKVLSQSRLLEDDQFVQLWSTEIRYPLDRSLTITGLAQFLSVIFGEDLAAKEEYLAFYNKHLTGLSAAAASRLFSERTNQDTKVEDSSKSISSGNWDPAGDYLEHDPLSVLAAMPLPLYITTSYFTYLESALAEAGKQPRSDICYWNDDLRRVDNRTNGSSLEANLLQELTELFAEQELRTATFELGVDYDDLPGEGKTGKARELVALLRRRERTDDLIQYLEHFREQPGGWASQVRSLASPEPDRPLVYHLHGVDRYPQSIVLTEDNYLDFLVNISRNRRIIPNFIARAVVDSSLLLIGYDLEDWDFRSVFRGLIASRPRHRRTLSLAIQLEPKGSSNNPGDSGKNIQKYLERYFDAANFRIYWGTPQEFAYELFDFWKKLGR